MQSNAATSSSADAAGTAPGLARSPRRDWPSAIVVLGMVAGLELASILAVHPGEPDPERVRLQAAATYAASLVTLLLLAAYCLLRPSSGTLVDTFALRTPVDPDRAARRLMLSSALGIAVTGTLTTIALVSAMTGGERAPQAPRSVAEQIGHIAGAIPADWWIWLPLLAVVTPVCEELVFRGFLFDRLTRALGGVSAPVILTSVVFAALHLPATLSQAGLLLGIAIVLGLARALSGSVWPGIVMHGVWNAMMLVLLTVLVHAA